MNHRISTTAARRLLVCLAGVLAAGATLSASAQDWGREAQHEDSRTCERFGADHGRDYTRCMLDQQRRRDDAPLRAAEQQRLNAEAARNNLETVRRMRCERDAKAARERGERPDRCR